ncbi:hypothetical protein CsatB_013480 [Cannabis sativa]
MEMERNTMNKTLEKHSPTAKEIAKIIKKMSFDLRQWLAGKNNVVTNKNNNDVEMVAVVKGGTDDDEDNNDKNEEAKELDVSFFDGSMSFVESCSSSLSVVSSTKSSFSLSRAGGGCHHD